MKRCKPARAPIYRDGGHYALDPHDDEVGFWLFRLGLRPARGAPLKTVRRNSGPLPSTDHPVTVAALDEAWRDGVPSSWSAQRVTVAVLDAHDRAMSGADVIAFVSSRSRWSALRAESAHFWRSGAVLVRFLPASFVVTGEDHLVGPHAHLRAPRIRDEPVSPVGDRGSRRIQEPLTNNRRVRG